MSRRGPRPFTLLAAALLMALVAAPAALRLLPAAPVARGAESDGLVYGPYLQSASETGITIVWQTARPGGSRVDYGPDGYASSAANPSPTRRHEVRLTGLRPGARYRYRVVTGGKALRDGLRFTTNKPPGTAFRFAVLGDSGTGEPGQFAVAARIAAADPDFVLHTGDLIYPRGELRHYPARFFAPYAPILSRVALWTTPGNHDLMRAAGNAYADTFVLPRNGPEGVPPERVYAFDFADAHVVSLDSNLGDDALRRIVAPWLRGDLAASKRRWKFVFFHHPPYSSALHGESTRIQRLLVPTLTQANVDIVFNGHDHAHERTRPIKGVVYIVSGAGGAPLYAHKNPHAYTARFYNQRHSFTLVEVAGARLRLRQIAEDGAVVDEVGWEKR